VPTDPDPAEVPSTLRRSVEQATRLAVGAVGAAVDTGARIVDERTGGNGSHAADGPSAGDAVVGAVVAAQERVLDATERAADLLGRAAPLTNALGRLPLVRPVTRSVNRRIDELAARGAVERREGSAVARSAVDDVVAHALGSEFLERTIDQVVTELLPEILAKALPSVLDQLAAQPELLVPMVEALLGPILDSALPDVLDKLASDPDLLVPMVSALLGPILDTALPDVMLKLNEQPEVVRELVLGQSVSIAGEMAGEVRSRGVLADDLAERIARRLTLRRPRAALSSPQRQLPAAGSSASTGSGGDDGRDAG
jgi:hypothetical protein